MSLPRRHRSGFEVLGSLQGAPLARLEEEAPLFAASAGFAREAGGPITRAFLAALPGAAEEDAIIDSSLVWLTPGLAHEVELAPGRAGGPHRAPPLYRHEPFPGHTAGLRGEINRMQGATHYLAVVGAPCTPEVAVGEIALEDAEPPEPFWHPEELRARDARIRKWIAEGALTSAALPVGAVVRMGWGSFLCPRPAAAAGFQLILRASVGAPRPVVNGVRNVSFI